MSRLRTAAKTLIALWFAALLLFRFGLGWYINSGRATPGLEQTLGDSLHADVAVDGLRLQGWLTVAADEVSVQRTDGLRVDVTQLRTRVTLRGLAARRIEEVSADGVRVLLAADGAESQPAAMDEGDGGGGAPPTVGLLAIDEIRIERGTRGDATETVATASVTATPADDGHYAMEIRAHLPDYGFTAAGTIHYRPGESRPRSANMTFGADWRRVLAYAGYSEPVPAGRVEGAATLDAGVVTVHLDHPGLRLDAADLGPGRIELTIRPDNLPLPTTADAMLRFAHVRVGDGVVSPGPVELRGGLQFHVVPRRLHWSDVEVEWDAGVVALTTGTVHFGGPVLSVRASLTLPPLPMALLAEYAASAGRPIPEAVVLGGEVDGDVSLAWSPGQPQFEVNLHMRDGSVLLDDFRQAAGLNVSIQAHGLGGGAGLEVTGAGAVHAGEVLWDAFYKDLGTQPIPLELRHTPGSDAGAGGTAAVIADLGGLGRWTVESHASAFHICGDAIQMDAVVREVVVPGLTEARPWTVDLQGSGTAQVDVTGGLTAEGRVYTGRVRLIDVTLQDATNRLGVRDLDVDLPFRVGPGATPTPDAPPKLGAVHFAGLEMGPMTWAGANLPVRVWNNTGAFTAPYTTELFGGRLTVNGVWGRDLFTPERHWEAAVTLDDVDLARATAAFQTLPLDGQLTGRLAPITFQANTLEVTGDIAATVYGGALRLTHLGVQDVTSPVRTLTADLDWEGIDLARATAALEFGQISGVLHGWVRGLEVQAGQPAAFEAQFETVPTPGVPQTVSFEAVDKISVLGTGRGLTGTMSRGLGTFFDSYGYRRMAFHCLLENDRFYIDSDIVGPQGQYFVLGSILPPRINVILRDASKTVRFAEMRTRIERLQLPTGGEPPREPRGVSE